MIGFLHKLLKNPKRSWLDAKYSLKSTYTTDLKKIMQAYNM